MVVAAVAASITFIGDNFSRKREFFSPVENMGHRVLVSAPQPLPSLR